MSHLHFTGKEYFAATEHVMTSAAVQEGGFLVNQVLVLLKLLYRSL